MQNGLEQRGRAYNFRHSKAALFVAIIAVHSLILLWAAQDRVAIRPTSGSHNLLVIALPHSAQTLRTATAQKPKPIAKQVPSPLPQYQPMPSIAVPPTIEATISTGTECDLTDSVQSALRASLAVHGALDALPSSSKSVANALMVWDGNWVSAKAPNEDPAFALIQKVIVETVVAASAQCQIQPQTGPRLLVLPGSTDTVVALGSGAWKWSDLVHSAASNALPPIN